MNQAQLAEALNVTEATVSRLISGERRPSLDLTMRVNEVLRWSVNSQALWLGDVPGAPGSYGSELKRRMELRKAPIPRS